MWKERIQRGTERQEIRSLGNKDEGNKQDGENENRT